MLCTAHKGEIAVDRSGWNTLSHTEVLQH